MANHMAHDSSPSTVDNPLFSVISALANEPADRYNFITVLAVSQKFNLRFLPITPQLMTSTVGGGGSSFIYDSLVSIRGSFIFKHVGNNNRLERSNAEIFKQITSEIIILRHPGTQNHPNIMDLEGLCWDISPINPSLCEQRDMPHRSSDDFIVWPVLVFQKSEFGDLYQFARSETGRKLSIRERLNICLDVGAALAFMHSHRIIHGDIKPQNVLIFKEDDGSWVPKIMDFGFSSWQPHDDTYVDVPRSWPWYAPEYLEYPAFTPSQAFKMDLFSFGMLCLWFVFEPHFSGIFQLPEMLLPVPELCGDEDRAVKILAKLKDHGTIQQFAQQLVVEADDLDAGNKVALHRLFSGCIACDPVLRASNILHTLPSLNMPKTQLTTQEVAEMAFVHDDEFNLSHSLRSFYAHDFRLRVFILKCLEDIVTKHPTKPLRKQLAVCYEVSFGHLKDHHHRLELIMDHTEIKNVPIIIHSSSRMVTGELGAFYGTLNKMGHVLPISFTETYREHNILKRAEELTRCEVEGLERVIGGQNVLTVMLKSILCTIIQAQAWWRDTEKLRLDIIDAKKRLHGRDHPDTLFEMNGLGLLYMNQNRWHEAEAVIKEVMETTKCILGGEHSQTLRCIGNLSVVLSNQGRFEEAERLVLEALAVCERTLGLKHSVKIVLIEGLVAMYRRQGRFREAGTLQVRLVGEMKATMGPEHDDVLRNTFILATIYEKEGRGHDAQEQRSEVEKGLNKLYDQGHLTLTHLKGVVHTYQNEDVQTGVRDNYTFPHHSSPINESHGADIDQKDQDGITPLLREAKEGNYLAVSWLLAQGADVQIRDTGYFTPLIHAAKKGHEAITRELIQAGSDIEAKGGFINTSSLSFAAAYGHTSVMELLLAKGADVESTNWQGMTPLLFAASNGHDAGVELTLSKGCRIEAENEDGCTALSLALYNRRYSTAKLLLQHGANIESRNNSGMTLLIQVVQDGWEVGLELLLSHDADIEARDKYGTTALYFAVLERDEVMAEMLLAKGANIETRTAAGQTPLCQAALQGDVAVIEVLLSKGADVNGRNQNGLTPLDIAVEKGEQGVVELLQSRA
ncbi:hypothetical protein F5X99DRAFT_30200 [Biscogniauxia marginata]|nr:hypothetical protein F5X99DRAFT_30200 [Biscogniauxia marginata]